MHIHAHIETKITFSKAASNGKSYASKGRKLHIFVNGSSYCINSLEVPPFLRTADSISPWSGTSQAESRYEEGDGGKHVDFSPVIW